jgi:Uma2 family endonuclease
MNVRTLPSMDKATFFRWIEQQERRFELVDGIPRMLPRVSSNHNRISMNIMELLFQNVDRDVYDISQGDFAIETGDRSVRFADAMVFPFQHEPKSNSTPFALLLVEVLSPKTTAQDFGPKLAEYSALMGVGQYVICSQDEACVWSWRRGEDGVWPEEPDIMEGLAATLAVPALSLVLPLAEIYRRVPIGGPAEGRAPA